MHYGTLKMKAFNEPNMLVLGMWVGARVAYKHRDNMQTRLYEIKINNKYRSQTV